MSDQRRSKDINMKPATPALDSVGESPTVDGAQRLAESRLSRIARRAHEIYEARGGENGKALEDWLRAEQEIDAENE